jgi:hypothetical protein
MDRVISCNYCDDALIVPYSMVEHLLRRYIKDFKSSGKLMEYQFEYLKMLVKICPCIESYVLFNMPDLYKLLGPIYFSNVTSDAAFFLRRSFLHDRMDTYVSQMIKCDYCGKEACNFHMTNGGFTFGDCNVHNCTRRFNICGWCKEKLTDEFKHKCIHCFRFLWKSKNEPIKLNKLSTSSIYADKNIYNIRTIT